MTLREFLILRKLRSSCLEGRTVLIQPIVNFLTRSKAGNRLGKVTSGGFGPSVGGPVAMGYVDSTHAGDGAALQLLVRGAARPATR